MGIKYFITQWIERPISATTIVFDWLSHLGFLAIRLWLFKVFFGAALTKIDSWSTTLSLFKYEYKVPLLPSEVAAYLGTAAELILPIMILVGVGARLPALLLFIFNIIAVISYPDISPAGVTQHILWGFMILAMMAHGPGKISLDYLLSRKCPNYRY